MKPLLVALPAAAALWGLLFSPWTVGRVPFWPTMLAATGILAAFATFAQRARLRELWRFRLADVAIGLAAAGALYGLFYAAHAAATALADFAAPQVAGIYRLRQGAQPPLLAAALLLWIGPAEEIFWRGLVQARLARRLGPTGACLLAAALYAAVHLWAMNLMLLLAATLCGLFWGVLFARRGSLWPVAISHAVWDAAIFIVWPIGG